MSAWCDNYLLKLTPLLHLKHRESWQNIGAILTSKADVTSFTLEVAKQLNMRYNAPPLPVSLRMVGQQDAATLASDIMQSSDLRAMFQQTEAGMSETGDGD